MQLRIKWNNNVGLVAMLMAAGVSSGVIAAGPLPPGGEPPAPIIIGVNVSGPSEVEEERSIQLVCTGLYSDGTTVTESPVWSVVAGAGTVDSLGVFTAGVVSADQESVIEASVLTKSVEFSVVVTDVPVFVTGIVISGASEIDEEHAAGYTCVASYSDGSSAVVVPDWSDNSDYAEINGSGILSASNVSADVDVVVSAEFGGLMASFPVTVKFIAPAVELASISISGPELILEREFGTFTCVASYTDGTTEEIDPVWSVNLLNAAIDSAGIMSCGNVDADVLVDVTATFGGKTTVFAVTVGSISDQVIYPLTGFDGKWVRAELYDYKTEQAHNLGQIFSPEELVIENVNPGQWYWVSISESNEVSGAWSAVFESWVRM